MKKDNKGKVEAEGLGDEIPVPKLTPALQPVQFETGVLARYVGADERQSRSFDRPQKLHTFELGAEFDRVRFALWGVVDLDMKLKVVHRGGVVFLRYEGKQATANDRTRHSWSVRPFHGTLQQLQVLQADFREGSLLVREAVELHEELGASRESMDMGDDLPF